MTIRNKKAIIEAILLNVVDMFKEQDKYFQRGIITETENIEEKNAIITKTTEIIMTLFL